MSDTIEQLLATLKGDATHQDKREDEHYRRAQVLMPLTLGILEAASAIGKAANIGEGAYGWDLLVEPGKISLDPLAADFSVPETVAAGHDEAVAGKQMQRAIYFFYGRLETLPADEPALESEPALRILAAVRAREDASRQAKERAVKATAAVAEAFSGARATLDLLSSLGFRSFRGNRIVLNCGIYNEGTGASAFVLDVLAQQKSVLLANISIAEDFTPTVTRTTKGEPRALSEDEIVIEAVKAAVKAGLVAPYDLADESDGAIRANVRFMPGVLAALAPAFARTRRRLAHVDACRKACGPFVNEALPKLEALLQRIEAMRLTSHQDELVIKKLSVMLNENPESISKWEKPAIPAFLNFGFANIGYHHDFSLCPNLAGGTIDLIHGRPLDGAINDLDLIKRFQPDDYDAMSIAILERLCAMGARAA